MKKRILSFFFAVLIFSLSLLVPASAEFTSNGKELEHNITYSDSNEATVETGTEITVVYTVENKSGNESFKLLSHVVDILFDHEFFEFLGNDLIEVNTEIISTGALFIDHSKNQQLIYFNGFDPNLRGITCSAKQFMGSFKLKVKATEGSSSIVINTVSSVDENGKVYEASVKPLTITVGSTSPAPRYNITYKDGLIVCGSAVTEGTHKIAKAPNASAGSTFLGWKKQNDASGRLYQPDEIITVDSDTVFEAQWETSGAMYTLSFETNGGTAVNPERHEEGTVVTLSSYTTRKSGYTFGGWYLDADCTIPAGDTVTVTGDISLYAKWKEKSEPTTPGGPGISAGTVTLYTLSFETNGGTPIESVSKVKNTTVDLSKYITYKDGYSFDGWYADKELENKITSVTMSADTTVYAKWVVGAGTDQKPNYKPDIFASEHYAYVIGRDGGYVYPNSSLTRAEASEMIYRLLKSEIRNEIFTRENGFNDVNDSDWFNVSVSSLANLGIIKGRTNDAFVPNEEITRAEFVTIMIRLSEAKYTGENLFNDIYGHWAENSINIAASIGWIKGENGMFRPNDSITRAEVITIINRVLNRRPESTSDLLEGMVIPPDNTDENAWYYLEIQESVNSHDFEHKEDNIHEKWTKLTESPDWLISD